MSFITLISLILALVIFIIAFAGSILLVYEKSYRAGVLSFLFAIILPLPFLIPALFTELANSPYPYILISVTTLLCLAFLYNPKQKKFAPEIPVIQHDERETMFSRRELEPGSSLFEAYYKGHPKHLTTDSIWREKPGLLNANSLFYDPVSFAAAEASFQTIGKLGSFITGSKNNIQFQIKAKDLSQFIKKWMKKQGMADVGITKMQKYHYYHTRGRKETYNQPVKPRLKYGIAFTVEMDENMMKAAPKGSAVMESAEKYLKSGVPAVQLAAFLREMGYEAQAHIDGNYEVICPLVARDAGLGEIGRMGLLMTPRLGPRVRIAVVTTNAPLKTDTISSMANSMNEFCFYCKKCATVCPSQSIPFDDRKMQDGVLRWKINPESCFTYWQTAGTDCGRCIAVCPYAHANNILHNTVRSGIYRSKLFRRMAVVLDDLFYGKRPKSKTLPSWIPSTKD